MIRVRHILFFSLLLTGTGCFAQIDEFGLMTGITNYFGDLNPKSSFRYVRPAEGAFYRYNIKYRGAWRTSLTWGQAEYFESADKDPYYRQQNLNFRTNIFEAQSIIEFNFFKYDKDSKKHWWTPYVGTGAGIFFFNPQGLYQGTWYYLQPMGTEGQNDPSYSGVKKYKLYSLEIPFEGGVKFSFARFWNVAVEGGLRETFTKYLDDVGGKYPNYVDLPGGSSGLARQLAFGGNENAQPGMQRGNGHFDKYMFAGITISYTIMKLHCPTIGNTYQ
jgi:Domain of unknown function (DUF6089)